MDNKILACETSNPDVTSLSCPNITFTSPKSYWTIGSVSSNGELESPIKTYDASLSIVKNFMVTTPVTPTVTDPTPTALVHAINFQPASSPIPVNFNIIDSGLYFNSAAGYGWTVNPPSDSNDRDNNLSPDQTYDTIIYPNYKSRWEIDLPNGTYNVTICMGDPDDPTGHQEVQVEGIGTINGDLSTVTPWIEKTISATLTDGRLTINFLNSSTPKLCWIKIAQ
jgi:hypothetical protein